MKRNKMYQMVLTSVFGAIILVMSLVPQIGYITILPGVSVTLVHIAVLVGMMILGLKSGIVLGVFFGIGGTIAALMRGNTPFDQAFIYPWVSIVPRVLFVVVAYYISYGFKQLTKLKYGKLAIVAAVSLISGFALYFGTNAIVKNATGAESQRIAIEIAGLEKDEEKNKDKIIELKLEKEQADKKANEDYENVTRVIRPIVIVLSIGVSAVYIFYVYKKKEYNVSVPSVMILGTVAHTILVLLSVYIFNPTAFSQTFGDNQSTISVIYGIAMANGLIEALAAVVIGTPIVYALEQVKEG